MSTEIERQANSGVTVEDGTIRIGGVAAGKVIGLLADDADPEPLSLQDLLRLSAMGDHDGLRPSAEHEAARKALTPPEREFVDETDATAIEHLEAHGLDVSEYDSVGALSLAVDNLRRARQAEVLDR